MSLGNNEVSREHIEDHSKTSNFPRAAQTSEHISAGKKKQILVIRLRHRCFKVFNSSQRDALDQLIGTVTCDNAWKQSSLPINISGLGVLQLQEQYRAAYVGSMLASDDLVQKITNQRASDNRVFKELYASLEPFKFNSYTQKKIQEIVDAEKHSELLRNQSPNREKARLQSLCLPHSGAWLAAPPVPALGLHLNHGAFQISVKYRLGIAVYEAERKCLHCRSRTLDIFGDTPSSVTEEGMQFLGMTGFVTVLHQLAQQLTCPQSSKNGILLQETILTLATYFCLHENQVVQLL